MAGHAPRPPYALVNTPSFALPPKQFLPPLANETLRRCVLKMDHHCPWMFNCIGHYNHRYFMSFVVFMWMGTCYVVNCMWSRVFLEMKIKMVSCVCVCVLSVPLYHSGPGGTSCVHTTVGWCSTVLLRVLGPASGVC